MDNSHEQEIYSGACGLNDPEEIEDCTCELLMRSSGSIGYRTKIFMKAVDGMAPGCCNPSRDERCIARVVLHYLGYEAMMWYYQLYLMGT